MVLSNKKLKLKLRVALADSIITNSNSDSISQPQALQEQADIIKRKLKKTPKKKKNKKKKKKSNKIEAETDKKKNVAADEPDNKKKNVAAAAAEPDHKINNNNNDAQSSQGLEHSATKVYVGGIPYYSTEDDIQSFFQACGTITEIDCMSFPDSGKFRGIAIIDFKTEGAAKRALALDGSEMGGLSLKIQPYKTKKLADFAPKLVEGYNRIYAGNLAWDITEDDLKNFFSGCNISSIRLGNDKETGEFKGYAHIDFADSASQTTALKLDQHLVCGRPIKISCAVALKGGAKSKTNSKVETTTTTTTDLKSVPVIQTDNISIKDANVGEISRKDASLGEISREDPYLAEISRKDPNLADISSKDASDVVVVASTDGVSAGKLRRRTCYECGGKGHISSDCPKKQTVGPTHITSMPEIQAENISIKVSKLGEISRKDANLADNSRNDPNFAEMSSNYANDVVVTNKDGVSAGKMRRRTCYECGGKGHISSDCPKKQTVGTDTS
ncbi:hypothetical protein ACFE04_002865 [Oxalis oulophora]